VELFKNRDKGYTMGRIKIILSICFLALFLAACSAATNIPATVTATAIPIPSNTVEVATVIIQATETTTQTPELTHTSTLVPTTTPTASPVPSLTPLSTLEPDAAQLEIARLMETNDNCQGACFWGIIPGVTDFEHAVRFLNTLKGKGIRDEDGVQYYNNSFTNGDAPIYTTLIFRQSNDIVNDLGFTVVSLNDPMYLAKIGLLSGQMFS